MSNDPEPYPVHSARLHPPKTHSFVAAGFRLRPGQQMNPGAQKKPKEKNRKKTENVRTRAVDGGSDKHNKGKSKRTQKNTVDAGGG